MVIVIDFVYQMEELPNYLPAQASQYNLAPPCYLKFNLVLTA